MARDWEDGQPACTREECSEVGWNNNNNNNKNNNNNNNNNNKDKDKDSVLEIDKDIYDGIYESKSSRLDKKINYEKITVDIKLFIFLCLNTEKKNVKTEENENNN